MTVEIKAKLRAIGDVSRVEDPLVRNILQAMKETLETFRGVTPNADVLDELVSKRELFGAGIIDIVKGGRRITGGGSPGGVVLPVMPDFAVPPAPTELTAFGGLAVILLTWNGYGYQSHAYTEIWRASVDDLGEAVMIGTAQGQSGMYSDTVGSSATYYYWVRFVAEKSGIVRVGPYNGVSGTVGQTGDDPAYLLEILTGEITSSQLHGDLLAPIELIPDLAEWALDVDQELEAINSVLNDLQQLPDFDAGDTYNEGDLVRYDGGLYQALTDMLTPPSPLPTDTDYWLKVGDYGSLGDAVAAHAIMLSDHDTRIDVAEGNLISQGSDLTALETAVYDVSTGLATKASVSQLNTAKSDIYGSAVSSFTHIASEFSDIEDDLATRATISQLNTAKSDIYSSSVDQFSQISAEFTGVRGEITSAVNDVRGNLIRNSSFEDGIGNHVPVPQGGTWTVEEAGSSAYHGSKVLQYDNAGQTATATTVLNGFTNQRLSHVEVTPGDRLRASIRVRLNSGAAVTGRLVMFARNAAGAAVQNSEQTAFTFTSNWERIEREFEVTHPDAVYVTLQPQVIAGSAAVVWFDGAQLERLDAGAYEEIVNSAASTLSLAKSYADSESAAAESVRGLQAQIGAIAEGAARHFWDFPAGADGWIGGNGGSVSAAGGVLTFTSGTTNSYMQRNLAVADRFTGSVAPILRARIRRKVNAGGPWEGRAYYSTAGHGASASYYATAPVPADPSQWTIVEWDMSALTQGGTDWMVSEIQAVRLDLVNNGPGGDEWEVDWVAIAPKTATPITARFLQHDTAISDLQSGKASVSSVTDLQAIVGDSESGLVASVQTASTAIADLEGDVYAEYTIKTQVLSGSTRVISGIGLIAEEGGSSIGLMANRIFFAHPSSGADVSPFVYDADDETVYVKNASIVNLTASNMQAGSITGDRIQVGTTITAPVVIGGKVRNSADTNYLDLNASGGQTFLRAGSNFILRADGAINSNNLFVVDQNGNVTMRSVQIRNPVTDEIILSSGTGLEWSYVGGNGRPQNYAVSGANLLYDSNFEKYLAGDTSYWADRQVGVGGVGAFIAAGYGEVAGAPGLRISPDSADTSWSLYSPRDAVWPVRAGESYYFFLRAFRTNNFVGTFTVALVTYNRNLTRLNQYTIGGLTNRIPANQWTDIRHALTPAFSADEVYAGFRVYARTAPGYVQVANLYCGRVPDKITAQNNTTFIDNAVINSAHIQDAAITVAHIQDAAITTAKIGTASIKLLHLDTGSVIQRSDVGWNSGTPLTPLGGSWNSNYASLGAPTVKKVEIPEWNPQVAEVRALIGVKRVAIGASGTLYLHSRVRVAPSFGAPDSSCVFYYAGTGVRVSGSHTPNLNTHFGGMASLIIEDANTVLSASGSVRQFEVVIPLFNMTGTPGAEPWLGWNSAWVTLEVFFRLNASGAPTNFGMFGVVRIEETRY